MAAVEAITDVRRSGVSEEQKAEANETPSFAMVPVQVLLDERVTPALLRVYTALALYANQEDGMCRPAQTTIADILKIKRQAVNHAIQQLVDLGYLLKMRRKREDGGDTSCVYRLLSHPLQRHVAPPCNVEVTPLATEDCTPLQRDVAPRTYQYRTHQNEQNNDANASRASADADDAPPPPAASSNVSSPSSKPKPRTRERKLSDEQLAAHREEQAYVAALIKGVQDFNRIKGKLPNHESERGAAHWFYRANDGEPAPVEDVMACYRATKHARFWSGKYLTLRHLEGCYVTWRLNPEAYTRDQIHDSGKGGRATNGTSQQGYGTSARPAIGTVEEFAAQAAANRAQEQLVERALACGLTFDDLVGLSDEALERLCDEREGALSHDD